MNTFDYIVVGSGAAGAIVASRLTENRDTPVSVCLVEAGPSGRNLFSRIPAAFSKNLQNQNMMWQFESEPSDVMGGRRVYLPQGKVLGGSTSINGLVYNRGQAYDYDQWEALGNPGWGYRDVLSYFRRTETRHATLESSDEDHSQYRGAHGPLHVSDPDRLDPICDAFIDAVASNNVPKQNDYNGASQRGAGYYQRMIQQGRRASVATAFLDEASKRDNLTVRSGVQVAKVLVEKKKAIGIETVDGEKIMATKEVILSAGTVNSAKLLQLSGIGDGAHLQAVGINTIHDLPGVGENFQDHYFIRLAARLKQGSPSLNLESRGWRLAREIFRWQFKQPSILGYSPSIAYAFLNSSDLAEEQADLQFVFTPGSYRPGRVYELDTFPAATCGFTQQRPESRGTVKITSSDPGAAPVVQPNYLLEEADRQAVIRGVKLSRQFLQTEPLGQYYESEELPGADVTTDQEILDYAYETGNTGYHLVGTCTMGPATNPLAVVGADLKVHGIDALRVIDASVMPNVTSSNTCAASMMIGEKGADMIFAE